MSIHLDFKAQIAFLIMRKGAIPIEYTDFSNEFSIKLMQVLLELTSINKYAI